MKQLCRLRYEQEKAKHEIDYLKQQISIYQACSAFEHESISIASRLNDRQSCVETIQQARNQMVNDFLDNANQQKQHTERQFQLEVKHLWTMEKNLSSSLKLTTTMQHIVDKCLQNISEHVSCLYKFKSQQLKVKHINLHNYPLRFI